MVKGILGAFLLIGGALLVAALVLGVREWRFLATSAHTNATVSRIDREWMDGTRRANGSYSPGGWGYRVTATFPVDGRTVAVRSPGVSSSTSYRVGDPIGVDYPPGRPDQAQLATFFDRWFLPLVLGGIGTVAVGICGFAAWLMRQPGTRIVGNGTGGFSINSAVAYSNGPAPRDPAPDTGARAGGKFAATRAGARRPAWHWLAGMLVVGVVVGLVVARVGGSRSAPSAPALTSGNDSAPAGDSPAPGYPPHLTVKDPTMTDTPTPPSWTDAANGGATPGNLTMAARAFVARPDQDAAMHAALRDQMSKLGIDCPGIVFAPDETLLLPNPAPIFDAGGSLTRGLIRQRFIASGCPGRSPQFNVWVFAPGGGAPVKTVAGFPGTTRASVVLMQDAVPVVLGMAARVAPGCQTLRVSDTHLTAPTPDDDAITPWSEDWLVTGCGKRIGTTVRFIPDAASGRTRIEVPADRVRLLDPA